MIPLVTTTAPKSVLVYEEEKKAAPREGALFYEALKSEDVPIVPPNTPSGARVVRLSPFQLTPELVARLKSQNVVIELKM